MRRLSAFSRRRRPDSFTLIELLVVIGIIALLGTLAFPNLTEAILHAKSVRCAANLRIIGMAAAEAATDNNNRYPEINQAAVPIYTGPGAVNMITALSNYGVTTANLQCPVDLSQNPTSYKTYGCSYEWDPVFDSEPPDATVVYITPTLAMPINSSRVRLAMDFQPIHHNRPNVVYGDGHVSSH